MKSPVQALLWEQWRQTWKVIPFSIAMIMIILWFLPQYFLELSIEQWSTEVGLIMCGILSGMLCIALQGEGGARGGTLANRHYVQPVSNILIATIAVVVFCAVLLFTLGTGIAFVAFHAQTTAEYLLEPKLFFLNIMLIACFVLAYSLTIGTRDNPLLRIVLALLSLFILVMVGHSLTEIVPAAAIIAFAMGISIPVAASIVRRDRHKSVSLRGGIALVLDPIAGLADQVQKLTLGVPGSPNTALLWSDLRGGKKLLLPTVIAITGILLFLAVFAAGRVGSIILTWLDASSEVSDVWGICLSLTGVGALIYFIARLGPRLAGRSNLFAPWSPEMSFWKRQPVMSNVLATVKLKSDMYQCLCWSLCLCAMFALVPVFIETANKGLSKVLLDTGDYLQENGVLRGFTQVVARPILLTTLVIWTFSGLVFAIALTGRRWLYTFGFTTLAFAALMVLRLVSLSSSWKYYEAVQPLKGLIGTLIIALSITPLVWTTVRGYADRLTLLLLTTGCFVAEVIIYSAYPRMTFPSILELSMYALPYAPLGLLPMAVKWGRRL